MNDLRTEARVVASLSGLLNPQSTIGEQYITGKMYDALGFIWMSDQTTIIHTNGTLAQGSATVNGANQTGLNLTVNALAGTLTLEALMKNKMKSLPKPRKLSGHLEAKAF